MRSERITASAGPFRRPGTGVRLLLFLLAAAGSAALFSMGFPPGAPDRLPILLFAVALSLVAAWRPERGVVLFCFLFPCAGLLDRLFGGSDPVAWPALLFGGLASGWTFRFLYDFESVPGRSRLDPGLRALLLVWALGAVVAAARARTLWAFLHGLAGRTVNADGLSESAAIRESTLALAVLTGGACFFFLLRRSGEALRRSAFRAALAGIALSSLAALLQAAGALPADPRPFWKMTGRLAGGSVDPNSLGLLCGLVLGPALASFVADPGGRLWRGLALLPLPAGLVLSGSRSGLILGLAGSGALLALPRLPARERRAGFAAAAAALVIALVLLARGSPGNVGSRLVHAFDSERPFEDRVSARPLLWKSALRLFLRHPIEGAGLGAFSWMLPDLLREQGERLPLRDNPGNAYLQALCETGILGFLVMTAFVAGLGREAFGRVRAAASDPFLASAGVSLLAFLLALLVGSHWLAADAVFLFFLLAALVAAAPDSRGKLPSRLRAAAVLAYAAAAAAAIFSTTSEAETFRHSARIGFHAEERGPGGPFRWTRRRFALRLAPGERARLVLAHYTPEGHPVEVVASVEGRSLFRRSLAPGEATTLSLANGAGVPRSFLFSLARSFVPKRLGISGDRRELGLVAVEPAKP